MSALNILAWVITLIIWLANFVQCIRASTKSVGEGFISWLFFLAMVWAVLHLVGVL